MPRKPINLINKQPEIITSKAVWEDFFTAAFEIWTEEIREPISQLERIRHYDEALDDKIIYWALYQKGFELPDEFLHHRLNDLKKVMNVLSLYHEVAGTDDFHKVISLLLGRAVYVEDLYTNNYCFFYTQPYGALNIDGGDWYKTSHVNLYIEALLTEDQNVLRAKDKLLEVFYKFCPINLVPNLYWQTLELKARIKVGGIVVKDNKVSRLIEGDVYPVSSYIEGPTTVNRGQKATYVFVIDYNNGEQRRYNYANWLATSGIVTISGLGKAVFGSIVNDLTVHITANWLGQSSSLAVNVVAQGNKDITSIIISGPSEIIQGTTAQYSAQVIYIDGQILSMVPTWSFVGAEGNINSNGLFTAYTLDEDQDVYITAKVQSVSGYEVTTSKKVRLKYIPQGVYPTHLTILGPSVVNEQSIYSLDARLVYSDNSNVVIFPRWESLHQTIVIDIDNSEYHTGVVFGQVKSKIKATYSIDGTTFELIRELTIVPILVTPSQLFILGPTEVLEKTDNKYITNVLWSDGRTTRVVPDVWHTSKYSFTEDGTLKVGSTDVTRTINISSSFTAHNITVHRNVDIIILTDLVKLLSIAILGPQYVRQGNTAQYTTVGTYSDGNSAIVTANWSLPSGISSFATISPTGQLHLFDTPTVSITEITAIRMVGNVAFTYIKPVVFIKELNLISSIFLSGPTEVYEYETINVLTTAIFQDTTNQLIIPKLELLSIDPTNEPDVDAELINIVGVIRGRPVAVPRTVRIRATYFRHVAEYTITVLPRTVLPVETIAGAFIIGPSVVQYNETVGYAHRLTYTSCPDNPILVSSDWSLNVPSSIAEIDNNGYLISHSTESRTITITSTHINCPDIPDTRTLVIQLVGVSLDDGVLYIIGPTLVSKNSSTIYTAEFHSNEGTISIVEVTWGLSSPPIGVNIASDGILYVADVSNDSQVVITATYTSGPLVATANFLVDITTMTPVFGKGPIGVSNDADITDFLTQQMVGSISGLTFTLDLLNVGDYGYFAHPTALGTAVFIDTSNNFQGGWDGATWPTDGSIGDVYGPLLVSRTIAGGEPQDWYLYRTDFSGLGTINFRVNYV